MSAMRTLLNRTLILLTVFGLIFAPPVLTGYAELQKAESAMDGQEFALAAAHYERAATLLSWRPDLWDQAGLARFWMSDCEGSIRFLEIAREKDVLSDLGWDALGICYFELEDIDTAAKIWETGLENYPYYAKYYAHLVYVYHERGNITAERDALEKWILSDGEPGALEHYRLGQLLSLSELQRAEEQFYLAASLDPAYDSVVETMLSTLDLALLETDESRRLVIVGRGLGLVGEWPLAIEAFRQAVAADGENAEAWAWLGEAEQQLGQDGRAALDMALKFGRTNSIVRSLRGLYWTRQGRGEQALAEYLLAAEYDPENPVWEIALGDAYVQNGDLLVALQHYTRATEIAPADPDVWRLLAVFSAQYGVQVEDVGLPAAQMAVELSGEDPLVLDTLGWTLALLERYIEARDVLEHAVSLAPTLAQGHLHLGIVALQLEDWQTALTHLQQARDLDAGLLGERAQVLLNQFFP